MEWSLFPCLLIVETYFISLHFVSCFTLLKDIHIIIAVRRNILAWQFKTLLAKDVQFGLKDSSKYDCYPYCNDKINFNMEI